MVKSTQILDIQGGTKLKIFLSILFVMIFMLGISSQTFAEAIDESGFTWQMNHIYLDSRKPQKFKNALDKFLKKNSEIYSIALSDLTPYEDPQKANKFPAWQCDFHKIGSTQKMGTLLLFENYQKNIDFIIITDNLLATNDDTKVELTYGMITSVLNVIGMNLTEMVELSEVQGQTKFVFSHNLQRYIVVSQGKENAGLFHIYSAIPVSER